MNNQNDVIQKEVKHIAVGTLALCVIMCIVYAVMGRFSMGVVYGALLGGSAALFNFWFLGKSIKKALNMGDLGPMYLRQTYNMRILINCACVVISAVAEPIELIAGIAPLFFPRITIFIMQLLGMYKPQQEEN